MKKTIQILVLLMCIFILPNNVRAYATDSEESLYSKVYEEAYNQAILLDENSKINDSVSAYKYLIDNHNLIYFKNNVISADKDLFESLDKDEQLILKDLITSLNVLVDKGAITIELPFKIVGLNGSGEVQMPASAVFDIVGEARVHARTVLSVYRNARFSPFLEAGKYFYDRVKNGGAWDYKVYLGTHTLYYSPTLRTKMSGETIGNFHYGYVGRTLFSPFILKTGAGIAQIYSGTSKWSFWSSYFDDPSDEHDIQWGINIYEREH